MENCCRFVFYNNIDSFCRPFPLTFRGKLLAGKKKTNCATITSFPWSVLLSTIALLLSTNQRARNRLVFCKNIIVTNYYITLAKGSCNKNSHFLRFRRFHRFRTFRGSTVFHGLQFHRLVLCCFKRVFRSQQKRTLLFLANSGLFQVFSTF